MEVINDINTVINLFEKWIIAQKDIKTKDGKLQVLINHNWYPAIDTFCDIYGSIININYKDTLYLIENWWLVQKCIGVRDNRIEVRQKGEWWYAMDVFRNIYDIGGGSSGCNRCLKRNNCKLKPSNPKDIVFACSIYKEDRKVKETI